MRREPHSLALSDEECQTAAGDRQGHGRRQGRGPYLCVTDGWLECEQSGAELDMMPARAHRRSVQQALCPSLNDPAVAAGAGPPRSGEESGTGAEPSDPRHVTPPDAETTDAVRRRSAGPESANVSVLPQGRTPGLPKTTLGLLAGALFLAGCATEPPPPPPPAIPQYTSPIPASALVGRYGLAAYHRPEDAVRTENQAKAQCSNPYIITAGPMAAS